MEAHHCETGFDPALITRYDGRGPRYTSYPTALQFTPDVSADVYEQNARKSNAAGLPLSLYVHVPFCEALCYYCGCNKIVTRNADRVARYIDALCREIQMQGELFDEVRTVEQIHFGGGTPTYLNAEQLGRVFEQLRESFSLDASDNRQYSIEVDPRTVDRQGLENLSALGFNRLSLGIQDFDPDVQRAINRVQPLDSVEQLVADARGLGFESVSFDLIYGLPRQSPERFARTLDATLDIRPDRLSVYNYAHLPDRFRSQRLISEAELPSPAGKLEILGTTVQRLTDAGYVYIGMDHFALPDDDLAEARRDGSLQRNFQGYSTHWHCELIGLGVSSIGSVGNVYAQNAVKTQEYEELIESGTLPVKKGIVVDRDDQIRAAVIQSLMCYDKLSYSQIERAFDIRFTDYFANELASLDAMEADGLIERGERSVRILPRGRYLLRNIAMVFDRYLGSTPVERFSKAI